MLSYVIAFCPEILMDAAFNNFFVSQMVCICLLLFFFLILIAWFKNEKKKQ